MATFKVSASRNGDQPARNRRYPSENGQTPEEADSDPTTLADESKPTWGERIRNNRLKAVVLGSVGFLVFLYVTVIATRLLPAVLANPFVQAGLYTVIVFLVGAKFGQKRIHGRVHSVDKLQLKEPNKLGVLFGDYLGDGQFRPYKGWSRLFRRPKPYTIDDLSDQYPHLQTKGDSNSDDPAIIGLQPGQLDTCETDMGLFVCQETSEVKPEPWLASQDVTATFPESGGKETIRQLKKQLRKAHERISTLEDLLEADHDEREMLREQAKKRRQDLQTEAEEWAETLVIPAGSTSTDSDHSDGAPSRNGSRTGIQTVHSEVSKDD